MACHASALRGVISPPSGVQLPKNTQEESPLQSVAKLIDSLYQGSRPLLEPKLVGEIFARLPIETTEGLVGSRTKVELPERISWKTKFAAALQGHLGVKVAAFIEFRDFLSKNYPKTAAKLSPILEAMKFSPAQLKQPSIKDFRALTLKTEIALANALAGLDHTSLHLIYLNHLKSLQGGKATIPPHFSNIFQLLAIHQDRGTIVRAHSSPSDETDALLLPVVARYLDREDYTNAARTALLVRNNLNQYKAFKEVITSCLTPIKQYIGVKDFSQAKAIADMIEDPYCKSRALQIIVKEYIQVGNFSQALAVTDMIIEPYSKQEAFKMIIEGCIKAGNFSQAKAIALIHNMQGVHDKALLNIAIAYNNRGNKSQAEATVLMMINDPFKIVEEYCHTYCELAELEDDDVDVDATVHLNKAVRLAHMIVNTTSRDRSFEAIAYVHLQREDFPKAKEIALMITDTSLRDKVLAKLPQDDAPIDADRRVKRRCIRVFL